MGLKEMLFGKRDGEYEEGNTCRLREEAMPNLKLAQLFFKFNPNAGYNIISAPESRLYSLDEIAEVLTNSGYASNPEEGIAKAQELIKKRFISFYWAAKGAGGVNIVPCRNSEENTKYKFKLDFSCDNTF